MGCSTAARNDRRTVAVLFPAFPVLHQTFVLWEVLALRDLGIPIVVYSLKKPSTSLQQPEGAAMAGEVHYLPPTVSTALLSQNLRFLLRSPLRYLGTDRRVRRHVRRLQREVSARHCRARETTN